jgi:tetratricopeptide (TPR) repeat protein
MVFAFRVLRWFVAVLLVFPAASFADQGKKSDPDDAPLERGNEDAPASEFLKQGLQAAQNDDYDQAISAFSKAIEADSHNPVSFVLRGLCQTFKGDHDKAIRDFTRAIQLEPTFQLESMPVQLLRASAYQARKEYDKAIADCSEVIRAHPKLDEAYLLRASAYRAKHSNDKAILDLEEAIRIDPGFVIIRAVVYLH